MELLRRIPRRSRLDSNDGWSVLGINPEVNPKTLFMNWLILPFTMSIGT